jgi:hypothetical protein
VSTKIIFSGSPVGNKQFRCRNATVVKARQTIRDSGWMLMVMMMMMNEIRNARKGMPAIS